MIKERIPKLWTQSRTIRSKKEFAQIAGTSVSTLNLLTSGQRNPSLRMLKNLRLSSNISTDYLLGLTSLPTIKETAHLESNLFNYEIDTSLLSSECAKAFKNLVLQIELYDKLTQEGNNNSSNELFIPKISGCFNEQRLIYIMDLVGHDYDSLAQAMNCKKGTVVSWCTKSISISLKNLEKLCAILQCNSDYLMNISNDPNINRGTGENIISVKGCSNNSIKIIYHFYAQGLKESRK